MAKAISATIKLEGAEEIRRLLGQIGQQGSAAFDQINQAVQNASRNLERVSSAVAGVERSISSVAAAGRTFGTAFGELGNSFNNFEAALLRTVRNTTLFVGAIAGAAEGLRRFVVGGINAGDQIAEQAEALGLSTKRYQELGFAASEAGVKSGTFASAMRKLSQEIDEATAGGAKSLVTFLDNSRKSFDDWGGRIKVVGNSTANTFGIIAEGARKLQAELAGQGIQRSVVELQQALSKLATGTAAQRQEFEKLTGLTLPKSADGLDALRDTAEGSRNALQKLGIDFKKAGADGDILSGVLLQIADKFAEMPDGPEKTAKVMAVFGRAAGPQLLPFLNQGSKGIGALIAKINELGIVLEDDAIKASGKAATAFDILARASTTLRARIGAAFAPLAQTIASGLTESLSKGQGALAKFSEELNNRALPYVKAFFDVLSGRGDDSNQIVQQVHAWRESIVAFGSAVGTAFNSIIIPAFQALISALDFVAGKINSVFGTELTGGIILAALAIAKIVGAFGLLAAALTLVGGLFGVARAGIVLLATTGGLLVNVLRLAGGLLLALVGWPALIVAGIAAAIAAIVIYRNEIGEFFKNLQSNAQDDFKRLSAYIRGEFRQNAQADLQAFLAWAKQGFSTFRTDAQDDFRKLAEFIKGEFRQNAQADLQAFFDWVKSQYESVKRALSPPERPAPKGPEDKGMQGTGGLSDGPGLTTDFGGARRRDQFATEPANAFAQALAAVQVALDAVATSTTTLTTGQGLLGQAFSAAGAAAGALGDTLRSALEGAAQGASSALQGLAGLIQSTMSALQSSISSVAGSVQSVIAGIISSLQQAVARVEELARAAQAAAAAANSVSGGQPSSSDGFAAGGYTGDGGRFQPAGIVHKGEHVQPAWVVARPGVLAFLEMLRRTGSLQASIARFTKGFSAGGLVDGFNRRLSSSLSVPGYASGGLVQALAGPAFPHLGQVDLRIGTQVIPVFVNRDSAASLTGAAVQARMRSAGRKPRN